MRNWFWAACLVVGFTVLVTTFGQALFQASVLRLFPPETPLSSAIVTAIYDSPPGFTDVTERICPLATPEALLEAVDELWPLNPGLSGGSFSKSNGFLEGEQKLWIRSPEQQCQAHVQTYSW